MQEVYKAIGRVADPDVTVLIAGRERHRQGAGRRGPSTSTAAGAAGPFLAINCAAIPESLLESELFGHEKGAFTGADRQRIGKFEQCTGGTLFLDEIGDMTPLTQAKVLRVLQEQQFERVGGNETIHDRRPRDRRHQPRPGTDDRRRPVSASDLYYRLNVFTIRLPPLRDRGDDLPLLVQHFLRRFSSELGKDIYGIAPEAMDDLRRYPWPGNVRELQSVLKQALVQTNSPILAPESLVPTIIPTAHRSNAPTPRTDPADLGRFIERRLREGTEDLYAEWLARTERDLLTRVLHHTEWNQIRAAETLGINRSTLRAKIASLGIVIEGRSLRAPDGKPGERPGPPLPSVPVADYSPALVAVYPPTGRIPTAPPPEARPHHPRAAAELVRGRTGCITCKVPFPR